MCTIVNATVLGHNLNRPNIQFNISAVYGNIEQHIFKWPNTCVYQYFNDDLNMNLLLFVAKARFKKSASMEIQNIYKY